MSLFQCDKCGCLENTACTNAYHMRWNDNLDKNHPDIADSYRAVLGIPLGEHFGSYCSACTPVWFTAEGNYGFGPRPEGHVERFGGERWGVWHNTFERVFLPKGLFDTNGDGNLAHMETLDTDVDKYRLEAEDPNPPKYRHLGGRLPRPGEHEAERWRQFMAELKPTYDENPETRKAVDDLGGLPHLVALLVDGRATIERKDEEGLRDLEKLKDFAEKYGGKNVPIKEALGERRPKKRRGAFGQMAALAAMAALAHEEGPPMRRELPPPREPTPEEKAAAAARSSAKIAAAEAKRARKAEKRRAHAARQAR